MQLLVFFIVLHHRHLVIVIVIRKCVCSQLSCGRPADELASAARKQQPVGDRQALVDALPLDAGAGLLAAQPANALIILAISSGSISVLCMFPVVLLQACI